MNIDNLTYGEMKEIASIFNANNVSGGLASSAVGKYVIVRSRNEGINAGVVKQADETGVILTDARRIWYHRPKDKNLSWYEGVAETGLSSDSKISNAVEEKIIIENYSLTLCTKNAEDSIRGATTNKQN